MGIFFLRDMSTFGFEVFRAGLGGAPGSVAVGLSPFSAGGRPGSFSPSFVSAVCPALGLFERGPLGLKGESALQSLIFLVTSGH